MALTRTLLLQGLLTVGFVSLLSGASYAPAIISPPNPMREFRGVWVATVNNIDWPSKRGLSTAEQKAELLAILNRAAQLKLNAIIFQVRPACDAMYASKIEPWSEYLTGTMGKAPDPFYDPLAFAIEEAHKRGLELHAWFNPFRALDPSGKSPIATNHVSKTKPDLVRRYGRHLWLDPGERDVQDYTLSVVLHVVKRYDVDGIHFDDYFYPYKEKNGGGSEMDFPDDTSWEKYGARSGLSRDDWRRQNANAFIERTYNSIKAIKPWVKFGISPFGIWRPGYPTQIRGKDAYSELYADSRKWLANGWLDYCAPQLYWPIEAKGQSFPALLDWWREQNTKGRHLWPGLNSIKVADGGWEPAEILDQIKLTRTSTADPGQIHWSFSALKNDRSGLATALENSSYKQPALVPASPWLDGAPPPKPLVSIVASSATVNVSLSLTNNANPWLWLVQIKQFGDWKTQILPGNKMSLAFDFLPEQIAISAVDRTGGLSAFTGFALKK